MRVLDGLGELAALVNTWTVAMPAAIGIANDMAAKTILQSVRSTYGTRKLADLADSTQDDRELLGYARNKPLLRDGSLLRDSVRIERVSPTTSIIGSDDPIHVYHEFGYWNAQHNVPVQSRPVFKIAAAKSEPKVAAFAEGTLGKLFGSEGPSFIGATAASPSFAISREGYEELESFQSMDFGE